MNEGIPNFMVSISLTQVQIHVLFPDISFEWIPIPNEYALLRVDLDIATWTLKVRRCGISLNQLEIILKNQRNKDHLDQHIRKVSSRTRMSSSTELCDRVVDGGKLVPIFIC